MKHPRCVAHWRLVQELLNRAVQDCGNVGIAWDKGAEKGSVAVTITLSPGSHSKDDLYKEFDDRIRAATPEMQDAPGGPP